QPHCINWGESPALSARVTWDASTIVVTSTLPANDIFAGTTCTDIGLPLVSQRVGKEAYVCMFIDPMAGTCNYPNVVTTSTPAPPGWPTPTYQGVPSTYTITNVGTETAYNVALSGQSHNGWLSFYYNECYRADADGDGWNDSLEVAMAAYSTADSGMYP